MKKYILSGYGSSVAVGLTDETTAETDINLSHNLFNTYVNDNYFNGVLCFDGIQQFYKFLIYKNLFASYRPHVKYRTQLKDAANMARQTLNNDVLHQNFMPEIYQHEKTYHVYKYEQPNVNSKGKRINSQINKMK